MCSMTTLSACQTPAALTPVHHLGLQEVLSTQIWTTVLWSAAAGIIAAMITASISRSTKIAEFRQDWINDLRVDIADYLGIASELVRRQSALSTMLLATDRERERSDVIAPLLNRSRVALWKIRLRINPRSNNFSLEDQAVLDALEALQAPEAGPPLALNDWDEAADQAGLLVREMLKREWEVTKRPPFKPPW